MRVQQLEPAIKALRESSAIADDQLEAMFAAEEERVATAHTLAEILLPLLTERIPPPLSSRPLSSDREADRDFAHDHAATPAVDSSGDRTRSPMLPGIADFIDEMLMQDRPPASGSNSRRSP
jgi:hypothetical protein